MKNAVIVALVVALAVSIAVGGAWTSRMANEEVLDGLSGTDRYGDVTPTLAVPPPPSCADASLAPDCTVLLAMRDTLAGDGALNWSADVPVTEWDGVTVSGTPPRVTGLDLRNRGLTGTIPIELGSLPPTLASVYLAGNAFTGCVPERLRLAENDLEMLMAERTLGHCLVPEIPWGEEAIPPGTYHLDGTLIVDIPASDIEVDLCGLIHVDYAEPFPEDRSSEGVCFGDSDGRWELWLDGYYATEWGRYPADPDAEDEAIPAEVNALFDQIATTARRMPPLLCGEPAMAPDCMILLAARDTLAGDGALNWTADLPMDEWDGLSVSRSSRRVTRLSLVNRSLTGRIPPELGNLTALEGLFLSVNLFTGCVPERLRLVPSEDLEKLQGQIGSSGARSRQCPRGMRRSPRAPTNLMFPMERERSSISPMEARR